MGSRGGMGGIRPILPMPPIPPIALRLMFRPLFHLALCLAAALSVARAGEPHPSLPPPVIPDCLGVNIHFTDPKPGEMEMLAAAGFKWVRMDFGWQGTERKKGEYDFSAYDRLVATLDKFKIRAVFILDYGNPLYAEPGDVPHFTSRAHTPEFREAFGKWAVAAVQHFKGRGYLWEMWNEPNGGFWKSPDKTGDYIALAKSTGEALRQAGLLGTKGEAFIGPATSTIDLPYLEACFKAGLLDYWDAVSVHPYRQGAPETVEEEYRSVRLLIRKYAPKDKIIPIISGEWGYSDGWNCRTGTSDIDRQFLVNIANDIPLSIWYDWRDDGLDQQNPEHHFGIVQHESVKDDKLPLKPKDAYTAVKVLTEELGGYRFSKRLLVNNENVNEEPNARLLLFTRGATDQKLVLWSTATTDEENRYVFLPASHGLFHVAHRSSFPPLHRVAAGDNGVLVNPISWAVKYFTPEKANDFLRIAAASPRLPLEYAYHWPEFLDWKSDHETRGLLQGVRNPLNRTIILNAGFSSNPGESLEAGGESIARDQVGTGSRTVRMARDRRTIEDWIDTGNGQRLQLSQETTLICTNPLDLELLPPGADSLIVRVLNPSGESATLTVYDYHSEPRVEVPVIFETGQTEKIARLPLKTKFGTPRRVELAIHQKYPQEGVGLEDVFYRDFGKWLPLPALSATNLKAFADGDAKSNATFHFSPAEILSPDTRSVAVRLTYQFSNGWKFIQANATFPPIDPSGLADQWYNGWPSYFAFWLHGDGKGCQVRIRFQDASGQTFQGDGPKIDFTGWRFVKIPMQSTDDRPLAHWGGVNDAKIHYPIKWDSIFLLDNVSRQPVEGEIFLSAPTLIY
ncbi:MAG: cellulase family glycosylhydrolase [Chthoniobacter sp.]|uniref:cellulase family glycosylhydrolase n=1 Tax=Chthoniobacter sp. TaxID=2510640 RepID=UPI0032A97DD9